MAVLQATGAEHLAGILASTHKPQVVRHTILYHSWRRLWGTAGGVERQVWLQFLSI